MKVIVETDNMDGKVSRGESDIPGSEMVQDAIDCFERALFAAGFGKYNFCIEEDLEPEEQEDDTRTT
jgi:hypothetical protein